MWTKKKKRKKGLLREIAWRKRREQEIELMRGVREAMAYENCSIYSMVCCSKFITPHAQCASRWTGTKTRLREKMEPVTLTNSDDEIEKWTSAWFIDWFEGKINTLKPFTGYELQKAMPAM